MTASSPNPPSPTAKHPSTPSSPSPATPAYSGQVDLLWYAPTQYRLTLSSPTFHQVRIVNGDQVQEQNHGDFYPRWLQTFAEALLDPIPLELFRGIAVTLPEAGSAPSTGLHLQPCIRRDDRPGGITDQMTWGSICFYDERMASRPTTTVSCSSHS